MTSDPALSAGSSETAQLDLAGQAARVSSPAQAIEFALILSQMISAAKHNPAQMRAAIYGFARAKLQADASWAEGEEREQIAKALENAIRGVESFCARQDGQAALPPPPAVAPDIALLPEALPRTTSVVSFDSAVALEESDNAITPAADDILPPGRAYTAEVRHIHEVRAPAFLPVVIRSFIVLLLFAGVFGFVYFRDRLPALQVSFNDASSNSVSAAAKQKAAPIAQIAAPESTQITVSPQASVAPQAPVAPQSPPFPLPTDYGVYALANDVLCELQPLQELVPDKRIAVSTPVNQPSKTTITDGKAKFIVYRRDLMGDAPDRIEIRVVARVMRALTFDTKGKPTFTPVSDTWNIRNVWYNYRVRPVPGNLEMLMVQPEKPDFLLPPGRYVLVLKGQGFDFTVQGNVTDTKQCLERTEAANGVFYSECLKS